MNDAACTWPAMQDTTASRLPNLKKGKEKRKSNLYIHLFIQVIKKKKKKKKESSTIEGNYQVEQVIQ